MSSTNPPAAPTAATAGPPAPVDSLELPIFLTDKDGELVVVPGFSLQDFDLLWKIKQDLQSRVSVRPPGTVSKLSISGVAHPQYAELTLNWTIAVTPNPSAAGPTPPEAEGPAPEPPSEEWIRVPLLMSEIMPTVQPKYTGPGEHELRFDPELPGFTSWIKSAGATAHELEMTALIPITASGAERTMTVTVPTGVACDLQMRVPQSDVSGSLDGGVRLEREAVGDATLLSASGLRGKVQLRWQENTNQEQDVAAALEANTLLVSQVDGQGVVTDAKITIQSLNRSPFQKVVIRLPEAATLIPSVAAGYTVNLLPGDLPGAGPLLEIVREARSSDPLEIRLVAQQPVTMGVDVGRCLLGGFEVVGAFRQSGKLVLQVDPAWHVIWEASPNAQQVDELPPGMEPGDATAVIAYSGRPFMLQCQVLPRKSRLGVKSRMIAELHGDHIDLEMQLSYQVAGSKIASLEFDLLDWQLDLDALGRESLVDASLVTETEGTRRRIALANPKGGTITVRFKAHRAWNPAANEQLRFPRPVADWHSAEEWILIPDDNVVISPRVADPSTMSRLAEMPADLQLKNLTKAAQAFEVTAADAGLEIQAEVRPGEIATTAVAKAQVTPLGVKVRATYQLAIRYEPANKVLLDWPVDLADLTDLSVTVDGQAVNLIPVPQENDANATDTEAPPNGVSTALLPQTPEAPAQTAGADAAAQEHAAEGVSQAVVSARRVYQVPLGSSKLGQVELRVEFTQPWEAIEPKSSAEKRLLLPTIAGSQWGRQQLQLSGSPDLQIAMPDMAGAPVISGEDPVTWEVPWHTPAFAAGIPMRISASDPARADAITLEAAWLQSWLGESQRVDRAILRVRSREPQISLRLPVGVAPESVQVWRNGDRIALALIRDDRTLQIPLRDPTTEGALDSHSPAATLVELRYRFGTGRPPVGKIHLDAPAFLLPVSADVLYWQVVLPESEYLVSSPAGFTHEYRWARDRIFWRREPAMNQAQLELWSGAHTRTAVPELSNCYLFSQVGIPGQARLVTVDRSWMVLLSSGICLATCLLLVYVPFFRKPFVWLSAACLIMAAGSIYPEPAWLALQAAVLGGLLAIVAMGLKWMFGRPTVSTARSSYPSSVIRIGSTARPNTAGSLQAMVTRATRLDIELASPEE